MHTEIDVRSDKGQQGKNNYYISEVICYLNGGAGEDDDEGLTLDVVGFEGTADVIGKLDDICLVNCCC